MLDFLQHRKMDSRLPRSEAEAASVNRDPRIGKPCAFEPSAEGGRIDGNERIPEVENLHSETAEAVHAGEDASGPQHSRGFGEQPILQVRRRNMVEHSEANRPREAAGFKWQRGTVTTNDARALSVNAPPRLPGEACVKLNGGKMRNSPTQDIGRQSGAGPDLQYVFAEVRSFERPG